ncbi:hypothetical protein BGZ83_005777 [Gryganskiella cystojenkinii]|nr:hypothetical protein BGZ83_005777 [Gryganskiella cystojenkinii]
MEKEHAVHLLSPFTATASAASADASNITQSANDCPRVRRMLEKHPAVKVDWRVPEPIKAAGETLRGVLIISAKDSASELKCVAVEATTGVVGKSNNAGTTMNKKTKRSHVAPSVESKGFLPPERARSAGSKRQSKLNSKTVTVEHIEINLTGVEDGSTETSNFTPGYILPGTRQGIPFSMRVPEKVGGTFKSAHASVSYELTAHVHIRIGREVFVLKHPLSVSLFELVQIRAARIASPHDISPTQNPLSISATIAQSESTTKSGIRFVIPQSNSVLGTASVRPYSLWGLGPATSSQSSQYQYSSSHGYGRYQHQRRGSLNSATSSSPYSAANTGVRAQGMTRSHSATNEAMSTLLQGPDPLKSHAAIETSSLLKPRVQEQGARRDTLTDQLIPSRSPSLPVNREPSRRRRLEEDKDEQLDEVGFGAHIDKSIAAAGENVTMDMFVCKSDLMKVVNIKVSLVETIQIYSFVDDKDQHRHHNQHTLDTSEKPLAHSHKQPQKKRLVDTHVAKVAKAYVPAQAEESHANDNHLKGYYEDYEDFRTTKSLSMYKLGMRIPERAMTIRDRELVKVEYAFIIKFFFKGRMGAFLELPIEIVSQYNHSRISTISGAISCVSNSVQIAMPPVPILIKNVDSLPSHLSSIATTGAIQPAAMIGKNEEESTFISVTTKDTNLDELLNATTVQQSMAIQNDSAVDEAGGREKKTGIIDDGPFANTRTEQLVTKDPFVQQNSRLDTQSDSNEVAVLASAKVPVSEFADTTTTATPTPVEGEVMFASPVTEIAAKVVMLQEESRVPSIVIDSAKSTPYLGSTTMGKEFPVLGDSSSLDGNTTEGAAATVAVRTTPALPLLFDLTSSATPVMPTSATLESQNSTSSASSSDGSHKTAFTGTFSLNSKEADSNGGYLGVGSAQGSNNGGGGLVAKIAKSITSSPLLRSSRSGSVGNSSSPNGSSSNLLANISSGSGSNSSSPQNPQSTTFTLAVTTLSALTLLSSVSQAAVVSGNEAGGDDNHGGGGSTGILAHGGGGGKSVAKLHRKGLDKLSVQQRRHEPHRIRTGPPKELKSCLKKPKARAQSSQHLQYPKVHQHPVHPDGSPRKKVTFAKGSTPSPSPTGSLIFIEPHQPQRTHHQTERSSSAPTFITPAGTGSVLIPMANTNNATRTVPHPVQVTTAQLPEAMQAKHSSPIKSPGPFSPRSMSRGTHPNHHHPFDSHPSRLSPLEKQTLENQELVVRTPAELGNKEEENDDEESSELDEGDEEDEEDIEEEDDNEEDEDEEDDERESEEQRMERRRLARVAWLAKYGDAFKQVYGAVPELPPI